MNIIRINKVIIALLIVTALSGLYIASVQATCLPGIPCYEVKPSGPEPDKGIIKTTQPPITDLGGEGGLLTILIQTSIILAGIGFFLYLLFGGLRWLTSGGDKAATQAARETITSAVVGLLIIVAAYAIIRIVEIAFGLTILSGGIRFPTP